MEKTLDSILIGFGSIGKRHLSELATRSNYVAVFDFQNRNPEIIDSYNNVEFFSDWERLLKSKKRFDIGVVATWGPTHLEVFKKLVNIDTPNILIEKPMASSLDSVNKILEIASKHEVRLFENFHFRYSRLKATLDYLEKKYKLGKLLQLNLSGGAKCISTTGIHYLDFCEFLLNDRPTCVMADLQASYINPRSESLLIYGGVSTWRYNNNFRLTMNFSNDSFAENEIEFVWKNAKAILSNSSLKLLVPDQFPAHDSFTTARVKPFEKVLENLEAIIDQTTRDGMSNIYDSIFNLETSYSNSNPGSSTKDLIRALIASEEKRLISKDEKLDEYLITDWKIS